MRGENWQGVKLLEDRPHAVAAGEDPLGLQTVVDELVHLIDDALTSSARIQKRRIGIMGGYGEGKSSALLSALQKVKDRHVIEVDAGRFRTEVFEFNFHRTVITQIIGARLREDGWPIALIGAMLAWIVFLVLWIGSFAFGWQVWSQVILVGISAIAVLLVALAKLPWSFSVVGGALAAVEERLVQLLVPPRSLLVVDNLDRVSVAQQRTVLRSLYRYDVRLGLPCLVVMDDSALATSAGDPESAAEMFAKVIHVEVRLPSRGPVSLGWMVSCFMDEMASKNPRLPIAHSLTDARLQGDVVRIVSLLPNCQSPRLVRRFLNDVLSRCRQLGLSHRRDIAALARLEGMLIANRSFRSAKERLARILAANDAAALAALWRSSAGNAEVPEPVARLFRHTRHLLPVGANWRRIHQGTAASETGQCASTEAALVLPHPLVPSARLVWELNKALHDIAAGYTPHDWRSELESPVRHDDDAAANARNSLDVAWPMVDAFLAQSTLAARLRIYDRWSRHGDVSAAHVWRLRLADEEALAFARGQAVLEPLLAEAANFFKRWPDDWSTFLAVPGPILSLANKIRILTLVDDVTFEKEALTTWFAGDVSPSGQSPLSDCLTGAVTGELRWDNAIGLSWPLLQGLSGSIADRQVRKEIETHLQIFVELFARGQSVLPQTLQDGLFGEGWLIEQSIRHPQETLETLSCLISPSPPAEDYPSGLNNWNRNCLSSLVGRYSNEFDKIRVSIAKPDVANLCRRQHDRLFAFYLAFAYPDQTDPDERLADIRREWRSSLLIRKNRIADPWLAESIAQRIDALKEVLSSAECLDLFSPIFQTAEQQGPDSLMSLFVADPLRRDLETGWEAGGTC